MSSHSSAHPIDLSIFKSYDIRGLYPSQVNVAAMKVVAAACSKLFPAGSVVIAHDIRHGSTELATALAADIKTAGETIGKEFSIVEIGIATTPMFYFLVAHLDAVGGCMITASHNPKEYNGVKVVGAGAHMISGLELKKLVQTV